ncbi:NnrS family protein [Bartonella sp. HY329]|uniref:NnrS family protein n=1 Tax=unclassified Bartonella TaxID=2645622 RepID=UPI0021C6B5CE|nr:MULTISPECIES: NnrS family protein [unclassified Bartonella]UXM94870.1 NnrS family protein [Bartonella sp. HY329]UXN09193.1 NnrS family protein [Bartonella sp. HY328]
MASSAEQIRKWQGPAILSYGYRPFFLFSAILALFALIAWIFIYAGVMQLPIALDPISWHAHSFIFGYLWAVVAGFLLTAVPNWTGRLPIVGWRLMGLFSLWLIGRIAIFTSLYLPYWATIVLDLVFPLALAYAIGREIIAGKNWRNLKILILVGLLIIANLIFDYQALYEGYGAGGIGARLGVGVAIMMIAVIGGRVVPSFTRNWLMKQGQTNLPAPHDKIDTIIIVLTALTLITWIIVPSSIFTAIFCIIAAVANFYRLYRWRGWLTLGESLVWVLHLAFFFIPCGFLAIGLEIFGFLPGGIAPVQHLWMAGAIGLMTLAIMSRASLGHSGRTLHATKFVTSLYIALFISVFLRMLSGLMENNVSLLHLSATLWIFAFGGFIIAYWNILTKPRLQ